MTIDEKVRLAMSLTTGALLFVAVALVVETVLERVQDYRAFPAERACVAQLGIPLRRPLSADVACEKIVLPRRSDTGAQP